MADSPKEILSYKLDLAEVESGARRMQALLAEISTRKAAGQETLGLEEQLQREAAAMGRLAPQAKQAESATAGLLKEKEKLASVVGLLGGQFGGMLGQLANVVAMIGTGGKLLIGFGAALAGITAGVEAYRQFSQSIKEAVEQQEKLNAAIEEANRLRLGRAESIAAELAKAGQATPRNVAAANAMDVKLRERFGLPDDVSRGIAAQAAGAGIGDVETAAQLAMLQMRGARIEGMESIDKALAQMERDAELGPQLLAEAQAFSQTPGAIHTRALALGEEKMPPRTRAMSDAFESLKRAGTLPAGVDSPEKLRGLIEEYERWDELVRNYASIGADPTQSAPARAAIRGRDAFAAKTGVLPAIQFIQQVEQLQRGERDTLPSDTSPEPARPGVERAERAVTLINQDNRQVLNIGTLFNGGARNPMTYNKPGAATLSGHDRAAPN